MHAHTLSFLRIMQTTFLFLSDSLQFASPRMGRGGTLLLILIR